MRALDLQFQQVTITDEEEMTDSDSDGPHEQEIVEFEMIGNRHPNQ